MFEIFFLGTGGSMPTEGRNLPAIAVRFQEWVFLFDAGEDVQRQFQRANLGLNKKMAVFISHMHADHILGLPGLLLRFSLLGRIKPLQIYGPPPLIEYVKSWQDTIHLGTTFETTVYGIEDGPVLDIDDLSISAFEVDHRGFALGYSLTYQRPTGPFIPETARKLGIPEGALWSKLASGENIELDDGRVIEPDEVTGPKPPPMKIVYSGDTRYCDMLMEAARNADVLISEAMYTSEHADLADPRGHMTAAEAAQLAKKAGVNLLVLTHYSPRYEDSTQVAHDAQEIFSNSIVAEDLMRIKMDTDGNQQILRP
ncbi:MAG: ribonuclease Z [Promethearchaeia archaeon]